MNCLRINHFRWSELRDRGIEFGAHLRLEHVLDLDSTKDICALIVDYMAILWQQSQDERQPLPVCWIIHSISRSQTFALHQSPQTRRSLLSRFQSNNVSFKYSVRADINPLPPAGAGGGEQRLPVSPGKDTEGRWPFSSHEKQIHVKLALVLRFNLFQAIEVLPCERSHAKEIAKVRFTERVCWKATLFCISIPLFFRLSKIQAERRRKTR